MEAWAEETAAAEVLHTELGTPWVNEPLIDGGRSSNEKLRWRQREMRWIDHLISGAVAVAWHHMLVSLGGRGRRGHA